MKKFLSLVVVAICSIALLQSCVLNQSQIKGNGQIVNKEFNIEDYNGISLSNSGNLVYHQNESATPYLKVEIDSNLIDHLNIQVKNNTLSISFKDNVSPNPTQYNIITNSKSLSSLAVHGSGDITTKGTIKTDKLSTSIAGSGNIVVENLDAQSTSGSIAGSGNIKFAGTAVKSEYKIAGSGNIDTKNLDQQTASCKISGSGDISVWAKEELNNSIAGSGNIYYRGTPKVKNSIAGSGEIMNIEN